MRLIDADELIKDLTCDICGLPLHGNRKTNYANIRATILTQPTIDIKTLPTVRELRERLAKFKWTSAKERLPSIRDDGIAECYLISDGDLIHMAYYVTGEWRFCESGQITEPMFYEVTHWMPLPDPPEEE